MSRIVVKNLPKRITEKRLREHFSSKGDITDLQLKHTHDGKFRHFAFIGFKDEEAAQRVIDYFDGTFIDTRKISVEVCDKLGAGQHRVWSRHSKKDVEEEKQEKTTFKKLDPFEEVRNDPEFEEFLKVQRNVDSGKGKQIWSDDIVSEKAVNIEEEESERQEDEEKEEDDDIEKTTAENKLKGINKKVKGKSKSKIKVEPKSIFEFTVKLKGFRFRVKKRQVKEFLKPLNLISLRIPTKVKGIAYAAFKTEKELKQALVKHRGFFEGNRISVVKCDVKKQMKKEDKELKWKNAEPADESVGDSGRIFIRNLSYTCTEEDLRNVFSKYGEISELLLPIDSYTKKLKGFAFVAFLFPEHAVKAFNELDGSVFQGRLLHLIPARGKPEKIEPPAAIDDSSSFKKKKQKEKSSRSGSSHNWNTLFLGSNALADTMTERYKIEKSQLLIDNNANDTVALRMALGETQLVNETRDFLRKQGVSLDSFSQEGTTRSKTIILVKNLPAKTSESEVYDLFKKFGPVVRVILPPSGVTAIVEMQEQQEAQNAFRKLAYNNFKHYPLYLEWAPHNVFKNKSETDSGEEDVRDKKEDKESEKTKIGSEEQTLYNTDKSESESECEDDTSLFIKNLNFETTENDLRNHFSRCGKIYSATIAKKKTSSGTLSMGYGFVQFKKKKSAQKALTEMQRSTLDGHALEIKLSHRSTLQADKSQRKEMKSNKQTSTKILIRNIPFEATQKEVEQLFSVFGDLKAFRLPRKLAGTGTHRGFGFADFVTKNDAKRAFDALSQSTHLYGRRLVLEWAKAEDQDLDKNIDDFEAPAKSFGAKMVRHFHHQGTTSKRLKKSDLVSDLELQPSSSMDQEDF